MAKELTPISHAIVDKIIKTKLYTKEKRVKRLTQHLDKPVPWFPTHQETYKPCVYVLETTRRHCSFCPVHLLLFVDLIKDTTI